MLLRLICCVALLVATVVVHAVFASATLAWAQSVARRPGALRTFAARVTLLAGVVLAMSVAALVGSALWAVAYLWLGALPSLAESLYFSTVTFTTLGYGDITLGEEWRLMSTLEAVNGVILFGLTTAVIVAVAQRLHHHEELDES